jgi:hypothetical protein
MSDELLDKMRENIRLYEKVVRDLRGQGVPEDVLAADEKNIEFLRGVADDWGMPAPVPADPTSEELEMMAFAARLAARQGTTVPDFRALFEKKAELDRKLLDEPPHDRP